MGDNLALHRDLPCSIFPTEGTFAVLLPSTLVPLVVALVYGKLKAKKLWLVAQPRRWGVLLCHTDLRSLFAPPRAAELTSRK